jgi:hypothetical protein
VVPEAAKARQPIVGGWGGVARGALPTQIQEGAIEGVDVLAD